MLPTIVAPIATNATYIQETKKINQADQGHTNTDWIESNQLTSLIPRRRYKLISFSLIFQRETLSTLHQDVKNQGVQTCGHPMCDGIMMESEDWLTNMCHSSKTTNLSEVFCWDYGYNPLILSENIAVLAIDSNRIHLVDKTQAANEDGLRRCKIYITHWHKKKNTSHTVYKHPGISMKVLTVPETGEW